MIWLDSHTLISIHKEAAVRHLSNDVDVDSILLNRLLNKVQDTELWEASSDILVHTIAASYCSEILALKPFSFGNDRTAILSAIAFLELNHIQVDFWETEIVNMLDGNQSVDDLAEWFLDRVVFQ